MPKAKPAEPKKHLRSIVIALLVVGLLALALLLSQQSTTQPERFFARDINDAAYDCEDKIRLQFGKNLINSNFDQISSRYESSKRQYIVYYDLTVAEFVDDLPAVTEKLAKCVVWERLGYVSSYTLIDI